MSIENKKPNQFYLAGPLVADAVFRRESYFTKLRLRISLRTVNRCGITIAMIVQIPLPRLTVLAAPFTGLASSGRNLHCLTRSAEVGIILRELAIGHTLSPYSFHKCS